ncbi:hypothetical protein [Pseudoglutamicibacter albus]|uniref:hypothetical protein n=1 Tax=Pseudoglutamicibacter albus TaxID=98671 RepID=UPI0036129416
MTHRQNSRQPRFRRKNKTVPNLQPHQAGLDPDVPHPTTFDPNIPLPAVPPPSIRSIANDNDNLLREESRAKPTHAEPAHAEPTDEEVAGVEVVDPSHQADTPATSVWTVAQRQGSILRSLEAAQITQDQAPVADPAHAGDAERPANTASIAETAPKETGRPHKRKAPAEFGRHIVVGKPAPQRKAAAGNRKPR